jgi:hypothetical protein
LQHHSNHFSDIFGEKLSHQQSFDVSG